MDTAIQKEHLVSLGYFSSAASFQWAWHGSIIKHHIEVTVTNCIISNLGPTFTSSPLPFCVLPVVQQIHSVA